MHPCSVEPTGCCRLLRVVRSAIYLAACHAAANALGFQYICTARRLFATKTPTGCIYSNFASTQPREGRKYPDCTSKILYFATAVRRWSSGSSDASLRLLFKKNDLLHVTHNGIKYNMVVLVTGPVGSLSLKHVFFVPSTVVRTRMMRFFSTYVASRPGRCFQIGKCFCDLSWVVLVTTDLTLMLKI